MADITQPPVMTACDAGAIGFARFWDFSADRYGCWERPFTLELAILEVSKTASTKTAIGAPGIFICTSSRSSDGQFWPLENEYGNA